MPLSFYLASPWSSTCLMFGFVIASVTVMTPLRFHAAKNEACPPPGLHAMLFGRLSQTVCDPHARRFRCCTFCTIHPIQLASNPRDDLTKPLDWVSYHAHGIMGHFPLEDLLSFPIPILSGLLTLSPNLDAGCAVCLLNMWLAVLSR